MSTASGQTASGQIRPDGVAAGRPPQRQLKRSTRTRWLALIGTCGLLFLALLLSLSFGSKDIALDTTWALLLAPDGSTESTVLHELRLPRTLMGLVVGAALGVAGALMQSLTRNPLADPGILGINAGASLAVVLSVALIGMSSIFFYLWFAFVGAAVASLAVYLLGAAGKQSATPTRLALAGVAISAALSALTEAVVLSNQAVFNEFRLWVSGSLEGRSFDIILTVAPFIVLGLLLALALAPSLNALALGVEKGRSLGVRVRRTQVLTMVAVTLLCGSATAAIGPVAFVGLAVPFLARGLVGSDQRWVLALSVLLGATWLLGADVIARTIVRPEEVQVGIVAALIGAPFFVALVRRRKIPAL
ncbi:MAG: iron chelate uptake ABC transporter family permease subunit [Coriobacteriales bacterium]|jgi:iron complex transport system permease protein|nr:iron chelate uptake ABC transporter family permease subunit [Coriobacteriales bacterium]